MKRRQFLISAGLTGALLPLVARAQSKPCPPETLSVGGGSSTRSVCDQGDAEADWVARSTGPGVVWAHDFRDVDEVAKWRATSTDAFASTRSARQWNDAQRVADPTGKYGWAMMDRIVATTLAADITLDQTVIPVTDISDFPDPLTNPNGYVAGAPRTKYYGALIGRVGNSTESVLVVGRDVAAKTLTVIRDDVAGPAHRQVHYAGDGIHVGSGTAWNRIMGAVTQTWNGKTVPDIGIANGYKNRDGTVDANGKKHDWFGSQYRFRGAYWGHREYEALYGPVWPVGGYDTYSTQNNLLFNDTFDGNEFWIQWRQYLPSTVWTGRPVGKLMYLQTADGSTNQQLYTGFNPNRAIGHRIYFEHNGQASVTKLIDVTKPAPYFEPTQNGWDTWMIHVKPGRKDVPESTVELFAAHEGDAAWTTLFSKTDQALTYEMPGPGNSNPPAYNNFMPRNYPNPYAGSSSSGACKQTNAILFTQCILSSQPIPLPRT